MCSFLDEEDHKAAVSNYNAGVKQDQNFRGDDKDFTLSLDDPGTLPIHEVPLKSSHKTMILLLEGGTQSSSLECSTSRIIDPN